jgi:hypothetical protein
MNKNIAQQTEKEELIKTQGNIGIWLFIQLLQMINKQHVYREESVR